MNATQIKYARERASQIYNNRIVAIREKHTKETSSLKKKYDVLVDQLVLGDSEEALRMLKDFEKGA